MTTSTQDEIMWIYVRTDKLVWQRRGLQLSRSKGMGAMRKIGAKSSFKMGERLYLEVLGPFLRRATSKQGLAACRISLPPHGGMERQILMFHYRSVEPPTSSRISTMQPQRQVMQATVPTDPHDDSV